VSAQSRIPRWAAVIEGVALYPDGKPAPGTTVEASTICADDVASFVQEATTAADGTFYIPPFESTNCRLVQLIAHSGLWLKTGVDPVSGRQIGTSPLIDLGQGKRPIKAEIRLGEQGSEIDFRVYDSATGKFIHAGLWLKEVSPKSASSPKRMLLSFGTERDGSGGKTLLAAGTYEVSLSNFACGNKEYWAADPVIDIIQVVGGEELSRVISVDTRTVKLEKRYGRKAHCTP
jgi:hypothetical protein